MVAFSGLAATDDGIAALAPKRRTPVVAIVAIAAAGLLGFVGLRHRADTELARAAAAAAPQGVQRPSGDRAVPAATSAERTTAAPRGANNGRIHIETTPPGASVREDGVEVCRATPCDVDYSGDAANPTREHQLVIAARGYRKETKSARLGEQVAVTLSRAAAPAAPAPARPAAKQEMPSGYKLDIPY
jgi:hypothetical protein